MAVCEGQTGECVVAVDKFLLDGVDGFDAFESVEPFVKVRFVRYESNEFVFTARPEVSGKEKRGFE
jgi:hypothetical protein